MYKVIKYDNVNYQVEIKDFLDALKLVKKYYYIQDCEFNVLEKVAIELLSEQRYMYVTKAALKRMNQLYKERK